MAYTPPVYNGVNHVVTSGYTAPSYNVIDFTGVASGSIIVAFLEQSYNLEKLFVTSVLRQPYAVTSVIVGTFLTQIYGLRMLAYLEQRYSDSPLINKVLVQWYDDAASLTALLEQPYDDAYMLRGVLVQPYILPEALTAILEQKYSITGAELVSILEQDYDLSANNHLLKVLVQPFSLLDDGNRVVTHPPLDGVIIAPQTGP